MFCDEQVKMCLCIGPEKCGDETCPQVRAYRKKMGCLKKEIQKLKKQIPNFLR
jgi:hypothetical protein